MGRNFITITILVCLSCIAKGQNTGIGITTPRAKLHVFNGASGNVTPFSPFVVESNGHTYINLLSPEANETSILFGKPSNAASGGIMYNAVTNPNGFQFRTNGNITKMVIRDNGYVGIGTENPNAPLGFPPILGKKITLYPSATGDYALAIQPNLLQIYTDHPNSDIAFGYDQGGGNLVERFRIKGNGAFVVNGSTGSPGQVLQTNGNGAVPTWTYPTNLLYSNTTIIESSSQIQINSSVRVELPGLSHTFIATSNTKVLIDFSIYAHSIPCFTCVASQLDISIYLDGQNQGDFVYSITNGENTTVAGNLLLNVGPGSHTISIRASRWSTSPDLNVGHPIRKSHAILQIIPQ